MVSYVLQTPELKKLYKHEGDKHGNTPLHLATMDWHPKIVRVCLLLILLNTTWKECPHFERCTTSLL
ncbi:hypothetical protein LOK49_LG06G00338 [Camellia lanceoleosa]|uniref:Uncharacterized protein n=1 Tax=Camellia lanceoleosa TaxID=1840588 RepID=A0ACC0HIT9_9ERIC|nr:hypothetical protein LOK49_LG06G00338 [Camellia lanceoleosa]